MKTAFLFPGQGSQSVGMGADICAHFPAASKLMDEFDTLAGYKLSTVCFYGPEESLKATNITQPALFATSVITLSVLQAAGIMPEAVAGHSVGEYAALVAAGAFTPQSGFSLVSRRGEIMQEAGQKYPGTMAAVLGLSTADVIAICREVEGSGNGIVNAANINGAGQVVISGDYAAVEAASALAKERGAMRVMPLAVSGAFHSELMKPAAETMRSYLKDAEIGDVVIPVVANVSGEYETSASEIRENLSLQIDHSVMWEQTMTRLLGDGFDTFVEVGSGKVLSGLAKRASKEANVLTTQNADELNATIKFLTGSAS